MRYDVPVRSRSLSRRVAAGSALAVVAGALLLAPPPGRAATSTVMPASGEAPSVAPVAEHGRRRDPLVPMLRRIDRYFQRHEVDGVVMDWRYVINASEAARLSVVSQLLGYEEIAKVRRSRRLHRDIRDRADYLIANYDLVHGGGVFDGMLGYAFLEAYDLVRDPRYLEAGTRVVNELKALPSSEHVLNGGLMGAMALAKHARLTGDTESRDIANAIIDLQPAFQHTDGSFPHWCPCSRDVHYTDWMATELILIHRMMDHPSIAPMLEGMNAFMERRVDDTGRTQYEEPCDDYPGCVRYYYSIATGCEVDYDTRAFTNELGYSALLFDHFGSPRYAAVMGFMRELESGGTWSDKWDFLPPPDDPYYVWTAAETSVVNTSLLFWSLGSVLSGRSAARTAEDGEGWESDPADAAGEVDAGHELTETAGGPEPAPRHARVPLGVETPRAGAAVSSGFVASPWQAFDRSVRASGRLLAYCDAAEEPLPPIDDPSRRRVADDGPSTARVAALHVVSGPPRVMRDVAELAFELRSDAAVSIAVFDVTGRRVRDESPGFLSAGSHRVTWDGRDDAGRATPRGLYFVRLSAAGTTMVWRLPRLP